MKFLIEEGADIQQIGAVRSDACRPGAAQAEPLSARGGSQMKETPLLRAAHNGHLQTVMYLVEQGADLNTVDLVRGLESAVVSALLLMLRAPLQGDNTALHWAAMRGHVEIVNFLLQSGADKNIRNKQDALPIDLCKPVWSMSWRYTQEVLSA